MSSLVFIILSGALLIVGLIRLDGLFIGPYWTMAQMVVGMGGEGDEVWDVPAAAMIRRFLFPPFVGLLAALLTGAAGFGLGAWIGGMAGFLLIWPMILHPSWLPPGAYGREALLWILYALMCGTFALLGGFGAQLGLLLRRVLGPIEISAQAIVENLVASAIWAAVGAFMLFLFQRTNLRYTKMLQERESGA